MKGRTAASATCLKEAVRDRSGKDECDMHKKVSVLSQRKKKIVNLWSKGNFFLKVSSVIKCQWRQVAVFWGQKDSQVTN